MVVSPVQSMFYLGMLNVTPDILDIVVTQSFPCLVEVVSLMELLSDHNSVLVHVATQHDTAPDMRKIVVSPLWSSAVTNCRQLVHLKPFIKSTRQSPLR